MGTGFVWHESYMWHDNGHAAGFLPSGGWLQPAEHVESPESKRRLKNLLDYSGLTARLVAIEPRPATDDELGLFHTPEYIQQVRDLSASAGSTPFGENCLVGPGSFDIAALAVGGVLAAAEAVARGTVHNAYALVRPPGHHAERDRARGFCLFNNVSVAAKYLIDQKLATRIAVVDWDVHHGNGTQQAFYSDPNVLTISIHQDRNYPQDQGFVEETGEGAGLGTNINVPLPAGSGRGAYISTIERVVVPALKAFEPDFIFVSSGFDASGFDPMAHMMLYSDVYREMTTTLKELAGSIAGGRLVVAHEGGYSPSYVPFCGLATVEALSGLTSGVEDPFGDYLREFGGQELQEHQAALISRVVAASVLVNDGSDTQ